MTNRPSMRHRQARGFFGQMQQVILRPLRFFQELPLQAETRTWLWSAILILLFVGYSAVRLAATSTSIPVDGDIQEQLLLSIRAAGTVILVWLGQIILLALVTMLQGQAPRWSLNFRIVIWASIPLALMALIQIAYMAAGGELIAMAQLADDALPNSASEDVNLLLTNFLRQIGIFSVWRMILFYLGAQYSLKASWWSALLITVAGFAALFLVPTLVQMLAG